MSTAAREIIDDIPEQPDSAVADVGDALMSIGDTILSITAICSDIRRVHGPIDEGPYQVLGELLCE